MRLLQQFGTTFHVYTALASPTIPKKSRIKFDTNIYNDLISTHPLQEESFKLKKSDNDLINNSSSDSDSNYTINDNIKIISDINNNYNISENMDTLIIKEENVKKENVEKENVEKDVMLINL